MFFTLLQWLLVFNSPATHPYISDEEKTFILEEQAKMNITDKPKKIPFKAVFTSCPMWAMIIAQVFHKI